MKIAKTKLEVMNSPSSSQKIKRKLIISDFTFLEAYPYSLHKFQKCFNIRGKKKKKNRSFIFSRTQSYPIYG